MYVIAGIMRNHIILIRNSIACTLSFPVDRNFYQSYTEISEKHCISHLKVYAYLKILSARSVSVYLIIHTGTKSV